MTTSAIAEKGRNGYETGIMLLKETDKAGDNSDDTTLWAKLTKKAHEAAQAGV